VVKCSVRNRKCCDDPDVLLQSSLELLVFVTSHGVCVLV